MALAVLTLDTHHPVEILYPDQWDPEQPLFIFAHGSGNDMNSAFIATISDHLTGQDIQVVRFNFPYKVNGKSFPDRANVLESAWETVIDWVKEHAQYRRLFIGGKSMGGRIAATVATRVEGLDGLIFLGYPLHPPGKFDRCRDEYLHMLKLPMFFIQGTRDPFARMDLLQESLSPIKEYVQLHWIEGGDHSFKVLVRSGKNYPEILRQVALQMAAWMKGDDRR